MSEDDEAICGAVRAFPSTMPDPCVLAAGHEGPHQDKRGEWWGGEPQG